MQQTIDDDFRLLNEQYDRGELSFDELADQVETLRTMKAPEPSSEQTTSVQTGTVDPDRESSSLVSDWMDWGKTKANQVANNLKSSSLEYASVLMIAGGSFLAPTDVQAHSGPVLETGHDSPSVEVGVDRAHEDSKSPFHEATIQINDHYDVSTLEFSSPSVSFSDALDEDFHEDFQDAAQSQTIDQWINNPNDDAGPLKVRIGFEGMTDFEEDRPQGDVNIVHRSVKNNISVQVYEPDPQEAEQYLAEQQAQEAMNGIGEVGDYRVSEDGTLQQIVGPAQPTDDINPGDLAVNAPEESLDTIHAPFQSDQVYHIPVRTITSTPNVEVVDRLDFEDSLVSVDLRQTAADPSNDIEAQNALYNPETNTLFTLDQNLADHMDNQSTPRIAQSDQTDHEESSVRGMNQ